MQASRRALLLRYGATVPIIVAAIALRLALDAAILNRAFPIATLLLAILIVAAFAGRGPALAATALGGFGAAYFLLPPFGSFAIHGPENQAGFVFYLAIGTGIALLGGSMRAARGRAEANEAAAVRQGEQFRTTLASIGDAVVATDGGGLVQFMNPVAEALTGWTTAEAAGRPIAEVVRVAAEATGRPVEHPVARVIRGGEAVGFAARSVLIARDGAATAIEDTASPIRDPRGQLVGVVMVFQDATARRRQEAALRESEERMRFTLDATRVGQWDLDLAADAAVRSLRHDQIFGYDEPAPEWGFDLFLTRHVHPDDRDRVGRTFREATAGGEDWEVECRILRLDGAERWIWVKSGIYLTEHGKPLRMLGLVMDITDRKRAEEVARAARDEAEEANRAKDRFLAMLSHELRTPLNPILLATTALLDRPGPPEELPATLEMIRRNVDLQARLIDDLLDVMRIVRGKMPLHSEVADAHALIRRAVEICRGEVAAKGLRLDVALEARAAHLDADPARFQQVIWNLVKNAVKFTPAGGSIALRTADGDGDLIIEVADTGIGIAPATLPLIFDPFQQGEAGITRKYGGLGLGLAICRGIVESHGGTLAVASPGEGGGTTFRIALPTVAAPPPAGPTDEPPAAVPVAAAAPALKILVVEDEPATRRLMARLLRDLGHDVAAEGTVADGVGAATAMAFDLVVSDIGLPDGSGLDLIRRVAALRGPIPAIALTGYGMEEDVRRSREAGFTAHLTKPIDFTRLEAMIRQVAG